jgi:hypothetical protein
MKYHLYNIRNVLVLITPANTYIQKLKSRINIYKTIRNNNKPVLVVCMGKYSIKISEKLFDKIYNTIDKSKLHNIKYISYISANTDIINHDINKFISYIEMQN